MSRPPLLAVSILWIFLVLSPPVRANSEDFTWVSPKPTGNLLSSAATDGKTIVAVGRFGSVLTKSVSASAWQLVRQEAAAGDAEAQVLWTGRRFIVAGASTNGLLASPDGLNWSVVDRSSQLGVVEADDRHSFRMAQLGDVTLAILQNTVFSPGERCPFIRSATHGSTWSQGWLPKIRVPQYPYGGAYYDLATHAGLFIVSGDRGTIFTSPDGIKWTRRAKGLLASDITHLISNGRVIIAKSRDSEEFLRSTDGITWSKINAQFTYAQPRPGSTPFLEHFFSHSRKLYAYDWQTLFVSEDDGTTWREEEIQIQDQTFNSPISWAGSIGSSIRVLTSAGGIFRIDNGKYAAELDADKNSIPYYGSAAALNGVIIGVDGYSSAYRVSLNGGPLEDGNLPGGLAFEEIQVPVAVARAGEKFVVAATKTFNPEASGQVRFLASTNGTIWDDLGGGSFEGRPFGMAGGSKPNEPFALLTKEDPSDQTPPKYRLYLSSGNFTGWIEKTPAFPQESLAPIEEYWRPEPEIAWDGKRFILRSAIGELWTSPDGQDWSKLPDLPEDSENFLLATSWSPQELADSDGRLEKNYAGRFASSGDTLVVRPAKLGSYSSEFGPDVFFVYSFAGDTWRRVLTRPLYNSVNYAGIVWAGTHFVAATSNEGLVATSSDGLQWEQRLAPAGIKDLFWSGSQVVAKTLEGGILTHPNGRSPLLPGRPDVTRDIGLGFFPPWPLPEGQVAFFEYTLEGEALVDSPIILRSADGKPLSLRGFARLVGGYLQLFLANEPFEVPLPFHPDPGLKRTGKIIDIAAPDFDLRKGTFLCIRMLRLDLATGRLVLVKKIPSTKPDEVHQTEKDFNTDLNGDGIVGAGINRQLAQGLYTSTGNQLYFSANAQALGQPAQNAFILCNARGIELPAAVFNRANLLIERAGGSIGLRQSGDTLEVAVPNFTLRRGALEPVFSGLTLYTFRLEPGQNRGVLVSAPKVLRPRLHQKEIWQNESAMGVDLDGDTVIGSRIYVSMAAGGKNTGQSWPDALTNLQDALDLASPGMEIWIARGTYKPSKLPRIAALLGITDAPKLHMFALKSGVALYGGFAGGETNLNQRNIDANPTILSGDHLGNDPWPPTQANQAFFYDNAYSVVLAYQLKQAAKLDGLTITGGNAYAFSDRSLGPPTKDLLPAGDDNRNGGGIIALSSDLEIADCTIKRNMALEGGGLAASAGRLQLKSKGDKKFWSKARPGSRLKVTDTLFQENLVPEHDLTKLFFGSGGAVHIGANYVASFRNVEFVGNSAPNGGAVRLSGAYRPASSPMARFVKCVFRDNTAICSPELPEPYGDGYITDGSGGALEAVGGAAFAIAGSLFLDNVAHNPRKYVGSKYPDGGHGGAIALSSAAKGHIATSVFSGNRVEQAGGAISLANWKGFPRGAALELYHCILHNNAGQWSGGIFNYGQARLRGHGNIMYENRATGVEGFVDVDNFKPIDSPLFSVSSFSSSLFTQDGVVRNAGTGNGFRPSGISIFSDPSKPAGTDNQWGTADDGYRLTSNILEVPQSLPPDLADVDDDGNFREPLPLDAADMPFGAAPPFKVGPYQGP